MATCDVMGVDGVINPSGEEQDRLDTMESEPPLAWLGLFAGYVFSPQVAHFFFFIPSLSLFFLFSCFPLTLFFNPQVKEN